MKEELKRLTGVWLGIETTGSLGGAALVENGSVISKSLFKAKSMLSEKLLPGIAELLEKAGVHGSNIEGIAVSTGPGSFTGIRIGISTAQGLSRGWNCGIVGVATLRVLAASAGSSGPVLVFARARENEVFAAVYGSGSVFSEMLMEKGIYTASAVADKVSGMGRMEAVGSGRSIMDLPNNVTLLPNDADVPSPISVANLGREIVESRGYDDYVKPLYMRDFRQKAGNSVP